jgi:hypothetical protein
LLTGILSCEQAKDVVKYADEEKRLQRGNNKGFLTSFTKTIDGRKLTVIAELKNNDCWLATAYYEN